MEGMPTIRWWRQSGPSGRHRVRDADRDAMATESQTTCELRGWTSTAMSCPGLHQLPALLQELGAQVRRLNLVGHRMGQGGLAHLITRLGHLGCPILEGRPETMCAGALGHALVAQDFGEGHVG